MLTFDELKSKCEKIHYFGLGFIQVKVSPTTRYHFYHRAFGPNVPPESIHNHRYTFRSQILKGKLTQYIYDVDYFGDTHYERYVSCNPNDQSFSQFVEHCSVKVSSSHCYAEGSEYSISLNLFHRIEADYAITCVTRPSSHEMEYAKVILPVGQESLCPFRDVRLEGELWEVVRSMW